MHVEHRDAPRLDLLGTLPGEVSILAPIAIRDMSRAGVLVESAYPLVIGSAHDMRIHLGDQSVVVRARVARCEIADLGPDVVRYHAGLEFIDMAPHAADAIAGFIDRAREQREAAGGSAAGKA